MSPVEDAEHPGIDPTGAGAGRIADHTLSRGPPKARRLVALAISAKATAPIMATPSIKRSVPAWLQPTPTIAARLASGIMTVAAVATHSISIPPRAAPRTRLQITASTKNEKKSVA